MKIGDRVRATIPVGYAGKLDCVGTIIGLNGDFLVEFDEYIDGHDGIFSSIRGRSGYCWWLCESYLVLLEESNKKENKMEYGKTTLDHTAKCCSCGKEIGVDETVYIVDGEYYDEDCFNENFTTCDGCGKLIRIEDSFYYDGEYYCDNCRDELFVKCYDCGDWIRRNDAYRISGCYGCGDEYICDRCYDNDWVYCENCEELFRRDDMRYDRNGYLCCRDCYDRYYGGTIYDYNYVHDGISLEYYRIEDGKRISSTNGEGFKGYGFELEVDDGGMDDGNAQEVIDMLNGEVYCAEDGSINNGFEIITHPHTREALESMPMDNVLDWLVHKGYRSHDSRTCGLHLHASKLLFGDSEKSRILNISKIVLFYERFWNDILKISRRTQEQADHWASNYCQDYKDIKKMVDNSVKSGYGGKGRYYAVNLSNLHTVEFRLMRGTLNKKTFWATLDFLMTCVENTKKIKLADIGRAELWLQGMKPETLEYIKSRGAFASVLGTNEINDEQGDIE